eukprot:TRINITY_DN1001_c0_g1_i1.p1 TRINITY_DN1001_c0_g1~~TRINITY_DN1001_c0_g1_i1.p1  ORF type:complete len:263 (+),score=71.75 TRINITY_DN1001_c0_g1_i1:468-1256(+)
MVTEVENSPEKSISFVKFLNTVSIEHIKRFYKKQRDEEAKAASLLKMSNTNPIKPPMSPSKSNKQKLSDEQVAQARTLFSKFDEDDDGLLDLDGFIKMMSLWGQAKEVAVEIMHLINGNNTNSVTFMEFIKSSDIWGKFHQQYLDKQKEEEDAITEQAHIAKLQGRSGELAVYVEKLEGDLNNYNTVLQNNTNERLLLEEKIVKLLQIAMDPNVNIKLPVNWNEVFPSLELVYEKLSLLGLLGDESKPLLSTVDSLKEKYCT